MSIDTSVPTVSEQREIDRANSSGKQPVVSVHGLWLLDSGWDRWAGLFEEAGYVAVTHGWPNDPIDVAAARADPDVFAGNGVGDVAAYQQMIIERLDRKQAIIGHSFGGVLVQMLAGRGQAAATCAISPAPSRGVLPTRPGSPGTASVSRATSGPSTRSDRKTWCRRDTDEVWSSRVKTCPTDKFINQIDDVFRIAQIWIRLYQNG